MLSRQGVDLNDAVEGALDQSFLFEVASIDYVCALTHYR